MPTHFEFNAAQNRLFQLTDKPEEYKETYHYYKTLRNNFRSEHGPLAFTTYQRNLDKKLRRIYCNISRRLPVNHRTASGDIVDIGCMSDSHLVNTIKMMVEPLRQATNALDNSSKPMSVRAKALYGDTQTKLISNYKEMVDTVYKRVGPYALEAALRGGIVLNEVTPALRGAFGRSTQDVEGPSLPELVSGNSVIDAKG